MDSNKLSALLDRLEVNVNATSVTEETTDQQLARFEALVARLEKATGGGGAPAKAPVAAASGGGGGASFT